MLYYKDNHWLIRAFSATEITCNHDSHVSLQVAFLTQRSSLLSPHHCGPDTYQCNTNITNLTVRNMDLA